MLLLVRILSLSLILLLTLVACGSPQNSAGNQTNSDGYTLELVGGTTSLDYSFFNPTSLTPVKAKAIEKALSDEFSISMPLTKLLEGRELSAFQTVATAPQAIAVNVFASVTKDGSNVDVPVTFNLNEKGAVTLEPYESWIEWFPLVPEKSNHYRVTASSSKFELSNSININPEAELSLLPVADTLDVYMAPNFLWADWDEIEGAKSYLGILYDNQEEKLVWLAATRKETEFSSPIDIVASSGRYEFSLYALSWDALHPLNEPFLPKRFDASIVSRQVTTEDPAVLVVKPKQVGLTAELGKMVTTTLAFTGVGAPLSFELELEPDSRLNLSSLTGLVHSAKGNVNIELSAQCPSEETLISEVITVKTSHAPRDRKIPVGIHCGGPSSATRERVSPRIGKTRGLLWQQDGSTLFTMGNRGRILTWDGTNYTFLREFSAGISADTSNSLFSLNPTGTQMVVATGFNATVFDVASGQQIRTLKGIPSQGYVSWSPDGKHIAVASLENYSHVGVFDAQSGTLLWRKKYNNVFAYTGLTWSHDSKKLAVSRFKDGAVLDAVLDAVLVDAVNGNTLTTVPNAGAYLSFTNDDSQLMGYSIIYGDTTSVELVVWDVKTSEILRVLPAQLEREPFDIALSYDETKLAFLAPVIPYEPNKTLLQVLDFKSGSVVFERTLDSPGVSSSEEPQLEWSPTGDLAISTVTELVTIYAGQTSDPVAQLGSFMERLTLLEGMSGSNQLLLTECCNQPLKVLESTLEQISATASHKWLSVSPFGIDTVAAVVGENENSLKTFRTGTGEELSSHPMPNELFAFRWSPDGTRLAYRTSLGLWQIVSIETGAIIANLKRGRGLAWSLDSQRVALMTEYPNLISIIEVESGRELSVFEQPQRGHDLFWLTKGRLLITGSGSDLSIYEPTSGLKLLSVTVDNTMFDYRALSTRNISKDGLSIAYTTNKNLEILSLVSGKRVFSGLLSDDGGSGLALWGQDDQKIYLGLFDSLQIWSVP